LKALFCASATASQASPSANAASAAASNAPSRAAAAAGGRRHASVTGSRVTKAQVACMARWCDGLYQGVVVGLEDGMAGRVLVLCN
jgi:hypothetical protein